MALETPNIYRAIQWLCDEHELRLKSFKLGKEAGEYDTTTEYAKKIAHQVAFKAEIDALAERIKNGELDGTPEV